MGSICRSLFTYNTKVALKNTKNIHTEEQRYMERRIKREGSGSKLCCYGDVLRKLSS